MFYAVPTARVIFTAKNGFNIFSLILRTSLDFFSLWVIESMR